MSKAYLVLDTWNSLDTDLYTSTVYVGEQIIGVESGDSAWYYEMLDGEWYACVKRGPCTINSNRVCTVIRGYAPPNRTAQILGTNLPYINGCSSDNLLPPIRQGDPTMQVLYMPAGSSEQEEHIHSTVRVVYVLEGEARCVYGMGTKRASINIKTGDTLVLEKMCPHHFVTEDIPLLCSPLHIWSSTGEIEKNHPMFNGTHLLVK